MLGDQDVFKHRHTLPQTDVLEGTGDAQLHHMIGGWIHNFLRSKLLPVLPQIGFLHLAGGMAANHGFPHEFHPSVGRLIHAGDAVEGSGFAGAVGTDEGDNLSFRHVQGQVVDCHHAAELHGHIFHAQNNLFIHALSPPFRRMPLSFWALIS